MLQNILQSFYSFNLLDNCLKFPFELLIAEYLFTYWLSKRRPFLVPSMLILSVCSFFFGRLDLGFWNVLQYLILFLISILLIYSSYECSVWHALYSGIAAYALQHIANTMNGLFVFYFPYLITGGSFHYLSDHFIWFYQLIIYAATYILTYFIVYKILVRRIKTNGFYGLNNIVFTFFISISLILVIFLNYYRIFFSYSNAIDIVTNIVISLYSIIGCLFALFIISGFNRQSSLEHSLEITKQLLAQQQKQYQISEENINLINIKCHDLKHQLSSFRHSLSDPDAKTALKEIESAANIYDSVVKTKNEAVNIILTEKSLLCEKNQIQLTCIIDEKPLSIIAVPDLYSILGNILDNAIEAVLKIPDSAKRVISLNISSAHNMLLIHCENFYHEPVVMKDGMPVSDKGDLDYHGFGMKSIKYLVEKYHGTLSILTDDSIFYIDILIPLDTTV